MQEIFKKFKKDKIMLYGFGMSGILDGIYLLSLLIFYVYLPPFVPLYNQLPWSEKRIGSKNELFIPVITAFVILLTNYVLCSSFHQKMPLVSRILCITTLLISLLAFLFMIRIIGLFI